MVDDFLNHCAVYHSKWLDHAGLTTNLTYKEKVICLLDCVQSVTVSINRNLKP